MFSSSQASDNVNNRSLDNHQGLNLTIFQCEKLQKNPIYSNYTKEQLHYVIDAVQKGRNPPTQIGLKRLIKRNKIQALKKKLQTTGVPQLNPKAPEEICLKALRTEFRNELEQNHMQAEVKKKQKSQKIIKRKLKQRARRNELIKLVKKYKNQLAPHFGQRLSGFGRCPKVSRQQIKDYLKTLGIDAKIGPILVKNEDGFVSRFFRVARQGVQKLFGSAKEQPLNVQSIMIKPEKLIHQQSNPPKFSDDDFPTLS